MSKKEDKLKNEEIVDAERPETATDEEKELSAAELAKKLNILQKERDEAVKRAEELEAQAADFKDKWYRTAAEFDNFRKRNAETRRTALEEGKIDAVKKLLFIGDNVERALGYEIDEKTKEGLAMLLRQFDEIIANLGLEKIDPTGEKFDPNLAEAIFTKDAEEGQESGTIDSVFQKGYKLGDKIIRYAQVVVIK